MASYWIFAGGHAFRSPRLSTPIIPFNRRQSKPLAAQQQKLPSGIASPAQPQSSRASDPRLRPRDNSSHGKRNKLTTKPSSRAQPRPTLSSRAAPFAAKHRHACHEGLAVEYSRWQSLPVLAVAIPTLTQPQVGYGASISSTQPRSCMNPDEAVLLDIAEAAQRVLAFKAGLPKAS